MCRLPLRVSSWMFALLLLALTASTASATLCTSGFESDLNSPNTDLQAASPGTTNFGSVCVTNVTDTSATITYIAASGFGFVATGAVDANVGGTVSGATATGLTFDTHSTAFTGPCPPPGGVNVDGRGCFNVIGSMKNAASPLSSITVTLAGNFSGLTTSTLLVQNALGNDAAAHIKVLTGCTGSCTGFVGENPSGGGGGGGGAPEPGSIVMFGGVTLIAFSQFRKRRTAE